MQLELLDIDVDNRVRDMRTYIKIKLYSSPHWFPDAKEIVEIGEKFKVVGRLPLDCFISIAKEYVKFMQENLEVKDEDDYDESTIIDHNEIISFYKKRLNMEEANAWAVPRGSDVGTIHLLGQKSEDTCKLC